MSGDLPSTTASGAAAPLVVFDLDGVLTGRDTFTEFVVRAARADPWRMALLVPAVLPLALTAARPELRAVVSRYAVRIALLARDLDEVRGCLAALGREFVERQHEWGWVRPQAREQVAAHLEAGDRVVVATATERTLARALLDAWGLHSVDVVASELHRSKVGSGLRPHNIGRTKANRLHDFAGPSGERLAVLYTDSRADLPLMQAAAEVVLVNGSQRLRRVVAGRVPGTVRVERWP